MKYYIFLFIAIMLLSCDKDPDIQYPKSYSFSHLEETPEGLFWLQSPTIPVSLPVNTGSYGMYRVELKQQSAEFIKYIFDIQEIELLSESTVRIHIIIDEEEIDTIVNYTVEDEKIYIPAFAGTGLFEYNEEEDQFELCGFTTIGIPGPNVQNPGQQYSANLEDCLEDASLNDYIDYVLDKYDFETLDTVAVFVTKFIYRN